MQDIIGNVVEPGDLIAHPKGLYGHMGISRVHKLTGKGLAYHDLKNPNTTRSAYLYEPENFVVFSKNHREKTYEEVREALRIHKRKSSVEGGAYDLLRNQIVYGSVVAFAQKNSTYVQLGQLTSYEPVLSMNTMKKDAMTHIRRLGTQRHVEFRASDIVLVTHDYCKINPALVDDLLVPDRSETRHV